MSIDARCSTCRARYRANRGRRRTIRPSGRVSEGHGQRRRRHGARRRLVSAATPGCVVLRAIRRAIVVWAVTVSAAAMPSAASAATWTTQTTPGPSGPPEAALTGVSCVSATFCMAVGSSDYGLLQRGRPQHQHAVRRAIRLGGDEATIEFDNVANGSYPFTVTAPKGFSASPSHGQIHVNGSDVTKDIVFTRHELPTCASRQLLISLGPESAAGGHLAIPIRFHDRGDTCSLRGYPRVDGLSASGRAVVRAKPALTGYFGSWSIATITLKNGQTASALLEGVDPAFFVRPPPSSRRLRVTPPNASHSVRLRAPYPFAHLTIHPVVASQSGTGR